MNVIVPARRGYSFRRYYDPATGQFISVDPAVDQTEAPYGYVAGDPVNSIDPYGLGILQGASDFFAGFGDTITFGGTAWVRGEINSAFGLPNSVNYCSSWYSGGGFAGFGTTLFLGGYGLLGDATEGGGLLARLRAIDWADETGTLRLGRAPEFYGGQLTQGQAMDAAAEWLGPGYTEVSPGRFLSADGERVVRYGAHETGSAVEHIHFEAVANGRVVENTRADIVR
jgi:uncharacterized protein RhaS with RHS repeats